MYWNASEISEAKLRKLVPWLGKSYTVSVSFANSNTVSKFTIRIEKKNVYGALTVNFFEQMSCCGYGNICQPYFLADPSKWNKKYTKAKLYLSVVEACAALVGAGGVQFVGTNVPWLFPGMEKDGWTLTHKMPNRRYQQRGNQLWVWCKNFNTFTENKADYPRQRDLRV